MKLFRHGPLGAEKPGLIDTSGVLRDLSGVVPDIAGAVLGRDSMARLRALDAASLPLVPAGVRIGACVGGVGNVLGIGLNYADHAAEAGLKAPGQPIVFSDHFATADGRVQLVPAAFRPAAETTDADYPMVLITGRQLEHWHTGSMTRPSQVLDAVEPYPTVSLNGAELQRLGLQAGDVVTVRSRRGSVVLRTRRDDGTPPRTVYIPFAYAEAAANLLTNPALDPFGKIPEFKYCAVQVSAGGALHDGVGYGGGESGSRTRTVNPPPGVSSS